MVMMRWNRRRLWQLTMIVDDYPHLDQGQLALVFPPWPGLTHHRVVCRHRRLRSWHHLRSLPTILHLPTPSSSSSSFLQSSTILIAMMMIIVSSLHHFRSWTIPHLWLGWITVNDSVKPHNLGILLLNNVLILWLVWPAWPYGFVFEGQVADIMIYGTPRLFSLTNLAPLLPTWQFGLFNLEPLSSPPIILAASLR